MAKMKMKEGISFPTSQKIIDYISRPPTNKEIENAIKRLKKYPLPAGKSKFI